MKEGNKAGRLRILSGLLFACYLVVLAYYMFFAEDFGRGEMQTEYQYNLIPFQEIVRFYVYWQNVGLFWAFTNILGNVVCFLPFGMFLPVMISDSAWSGPKVVLSGFLLSLVIESMQLMFKVGVFDVDDLLLNTFGAFAGYFLYRLGRKWSRLCRFKKD